MEHPVKESFYFPASAIAAQFVSILAFAPVLPVRSNQFDAIFLGELLVERVGVIDVVANARAGSWSRKPPAKTSSWRSALHLDLSRPSENSF